MHMSGCLCGGTSASASVCFVAAALLPPPPRWACPRPAGVAALLATYSLETTRTRMALGTAPGSLPTALAGIVRAEGAGALFKVSAAGSAA